MAAPLTDDEFFSKGAQAVRGLLERHGIPKHRHSAFVGEFFELSRAAAHQRVSKSTAWTLEELTALAEHFGETLAHVVQPHAGGATETQAGLQATLCVGEAQMLCRIWLHPGHAPLPGDVFVALAAGDRHVVMPSVAVPAAHALRIARLEIDQCAPASRRVAVLDADTASGRSICDRLQSAGMDAQAFHDAAALAQAVAHRAGFDGYVIDWAPSDPGIHALLSAIRMQKPPRGLVVLSGSMRAEPQGLEALAQVLSRYKAQLVEKPVQLPLLLAALQNGFSG